MAGETVILVSPEHGRNLQPNPIQDENDWYAYDHSDANSLRTFSMMAGKGVPANLVRVVKVILLVVLPTMYLPLQKYWE